MSNENLGVYERVDLRIECWWLVVIKIEKWWLIRVDEGKKPRGLFGLKYVCEL